ncbi:M15 family metallopeptidase [Cohnella fermenti]|uniref:M15 family metallopeptidase n=1 Tax=Cohnella fermenti TaxID=2565925 RepID=UPI001E2B0461|nr:M15 family metallopeptidase [Cohnella fermenti]
MGTKAKLLTAVVAAGVLIWGFTQIGEWDVWAQKGSSASLEPSASAPSSPSASASQTPAQSSPEASAPASAAPSDDSEEGTSSPASTPPAPPSEEPDALTAMLLQNAPAVTTKKNEDGLAVITNSDSLLVLVNKKRNLPSTYIPEDLVGPNVEFSFSGDSPKKQMRKVAAGALEELFAAAKKDGITLKAVSGYRSYATQKSIFDRNAELKGADVANQTSAHPGQSEHQTGLAMDVSSSSANYELETKFGDTKEGKWLAKHAHEHGFIIRYPEGLQDITGYTYEPWHVRYVGQDIADAVYDSGLTLEEYMESYDQQAKEALASAKS